MLDGVEHFNSYAGRPCQLPYLAQHVSATSPDHYYARVSVSDGQEALNDAELITPVGSTNALSLFDQIPEPTSKLRNMEEVKLRLKPAPIIQINERHTVL